jgi:hypothetical protein
MSVPQCIEAYKSVSRQAFTPRRRLNIPASPNGQYSGEELEKALKQVVSEQCKDEDLLFRNEKGCKTFVASPSSKLQFRIATNLYLVSSLQSPRAISQLSRHCSGPTPYHPQWKPAKSGKWPARHRPQLPSSTV